MKEIIAIIRPNKVTATKRALDRLGFPSMSVVAVFGRGKQKGIANEVAVEISPIVRGLGSFKGMPYVPKRLLSIVVPAEMLNKVVNTIIKVNQILPIDFSFKYGKLLANMILIDQLQCVFK